MLLDGQTVPTVGYVGAGAEVYSIDDIAMGDSLDEGGVEMPFSGSPNAVSVICSGRQHGASLP